MRTATLAPRRRADALAFRDTQTKSGTIALTTVATNDVHRAPKQNARHVVSTARNGQLGQPTAAAAARYIDAWLSAFDRALSPGGGGHTSSSFRGGARIPGWRDAGASEYEVR